MPLPISLPALRPSSDGESLDLDSTAAAAAAADHGTWCGSDDRRGAVQDPHVVLSGVPELLRLADGGTRPQLQEGPAARARDPAAKLHGRRTQGLQRDGLGPDYGGPLHEQAPEDW